ncbi:MAG: aminotransferase class III-fold pyridoxal phosphate-dependent enzyme [Steroidobacteraceae bacterium]
MYLAIIAIVSVLLGCLVIIRAFMRRIALSRAKHPSLAGHARIARRFARLVPFYDYDADSFFAVDGAPAPIVTRRREGFAQLADRFRAHDQLSRPLAERARTILSDMQFTSRYQVPFQFSALVRQQLQVPIFFVSSNGMELTDIDGKCSFDLSGSYGVNVLGYDFYKACIEKGNSAVKDLGPVLGAYHPLVVDVVRRLKQISHLDEVSFHMSGTEAVMQAVRLARYHTGRSKLVRFCGAYHGWWGDVQSGVGNPTVATDTYTLRDIDERSLSVVRARDDIACVLINPLQALHPNSNAPADSALVASRHTRRISRDDYARWLGQLREICTERRIPLIFDEVFVGFRLAVGGAQEYFGVRADLVTYGKTLGGGLPVGVLCGQMDLMRRFRSDRPADICFARGTFNTHPYVIGAMHAFLSTLDDPEIQTEYISLDSRWSARAAALNEQLSAASVPVAVTNLSSIFTTNYLSSSRYNWMLQFYLRAQGLHLSWVGTGRFIFPIGASDADFENVSERFVTAARLAAADGWFYVPAGQNDRTISLQLLREMIQARFRTSHMGSIHSPRNRYSGAL